MDGTNIPWAPFHVAQTYLRTVYNGQIYKLHTAPKQIFRITFIRGLFHKIKIKKQIRQSLMQ